MYEKDVSNNGPVSNLIVLFAINAAENSGAVTKLLILLPRASSFASRNPTAFEHHPSMSRLQRVSLVVQGIAWVLELDEPAD